VRYPTDAEIAEREEAIMWLFDEMNAEDEEWDRREYYCPEWDASFDAWWTV
jgi:hypothetical protein